MQDDHKPSAELFQPLQPDQETSGSHAVPSGGIPQPAAGSGVADSTEAGTLASYREFISQRYAYLPFPGSVRGEGSNRIPRLQRLYVDLDTELQVSDSAVHRALASGEALPLHSSALGRAGDLRPLAALEAVALNSRLLLLGDPGAGKTTFIHALCLALAGNECQELGQWGRQVRLPLPVSLGGFARWLAAQPILADIGASLLWDYVNHDLQQHQLGFMLDPLQRALAEGSVQLLLDGLDEVKSELLRTVVKVLGDFERNHANAWLLITCRVANYEQIPWRLPEERFTVLHLAPFDSSKIQRFITTWYTEWATGDDKGTVACRHALRLNTALTQSGLLGLAGNPLLLTLISLVYAYDRILPDQRAALYERAVDILLWRRHRDKRRADLLVRLREVGQGAADLLRVLRWYAATTYSGSETARPSGTADTALEGALASLHPRQERDWAHALLAQLCRHSGLLGTRDGTFAFAHRTLQEYLAGVQLALDKNFAGLAAKLAGDGILWWEVILFAVGYKVHVQGELETPLDLASALCSPREPQGDGDWRIVQLAGRVLWEIGLNRLNEPRSAGPKLMKRVSRQLTALLERGRLGPLERSRAGEIVGYLGDPRFDPERLYLPHRYNGEIDRGGGFVRIPTGILRMGAAGSKPKTADPQRGKQIPYPYWIARYPVTVAQFAVFVADAGYADPRWWWTEAAADWLREEGASAPGDWEHQCLYLTRPITQVNWFEAMAYCTWLDARLRALEHDPLPLDYRVRLPTEAEWEKAARDNDTLLYTWGNKAWDEQRANVRESHIGHPTPVGMYPQGATANGLYDLAGNVWEWTLNSWEDATEPLPSGDGENYQRVLRGGSWSDPSDAARCAQRGREHASIRDAGIGFRVVVSLAKAEQ